MTFWLDEQFDLKIARFLSASFDIDVRTAYQLGFRETDDATIFHAARVRRDVTLVTKDEDFVRLIRRLGPPPQVVFLTFGNLFTTPLKAKLATSFPAALARITAGEPLVRID